LGDIYALGVLLYQIVTGSFHEPPLPGWEQKIGDPLLRQDIADAANVDPAKRIQTVAELASRLQRLPTRREEKQREEREESEAAATREALARTRLLRPWAIFAVASLAIGLGVASFAAYRAVRDRNAAEKSNAISKAMFDFLAIDILAQTDPSRPAAGAGSTSQQSLVSAIAIAAPQIDSRFAHQPEIAGQLHLTMADSLKNRSRFADADHEYSAASERFRQAEGSLSQDAIAAELKRELAEISSILPGSIEAAKEGFAKQEQLIGQLKDSTAELHAWETLVKTALMGMGPHPEEVVPLLNAAIQRAEKTPDFDPALLLRLKKQFCGTYVRMGDGANLERVSREIIALIVKQNGAASPALFLYQMYLEEAFYLQGKYAESIAQGDQNFARFSAVLGGQNQLTRGTLATRAAAEGQLERYSDAVRDDLALHAAASLDPSDKRLEAGSLNDAATFECRSGDFQTGIRHAREVIQDTGTGPLAQPMFFNGSMFTLAECLIGEQEVYPSRPDVKALTEARALLAKVDIKSMSETSDESAYEGARDLAQARVALLRRQYEEARSYISAAAPFFARPNADPYELRAFQAAKRELAQNMHTRS
jgi:non-specific serine/threonine protein kinase